MGVAALIMGILSLVFCWVPFLCWIFPILGVIFGAVGIKKQKGMSIAGLVMSIIALALWILIFGIAGAAVCSL